MSSGREFQSVNTLLKDLSSPQFVFDLIDLQVLLEMLNRLADAFGWAVPLSFFFFFFFFWGGGGGGAESVNGKIKN